MVQTESMQTELYAISKRVQGLAEKNDDQKYAEYYRLRGKGFQSTLKLIDSQRAQRARKPYSIPGIELI